MKKPKYFKLSELIGSETALKNKIENIPTWEELSSLYILATDYLDPIREAYGEALNISSGFRSEELNNAVNGSTTSSHREGKAVDIQPNKPTKENVYDLWKFICNFLQKNNMKWDQCYIENSKGKVWWVHLGIGDKMRCESGAWTKD